MADVETSTLVKAIIAIIVLLVMALVIYSLMNFDDVKQIAQEVFHVDTQEEINTKTEDTVSEFSSDLDSCAKGDYNPNNEDACFCYQRSPGVIQEGSYISISNSGSTSQFTTLSENDAPISQFTKNYNLGFKTFISNNHCYGITRQFQRTKFEGRQEACGPKGYSPPDFVKICDEVISCADFAASDLECICV